MIVALSITISLGVIAGFLVAFRSGTHLANKVQIRRRLANEFKDPCHHTPHHLYKDATIPPSLVQNDNLGAQERGSRFRSLLESAGLRKGSNRLLLQADRLRKQFEHVLAQAGVRVRIRYLLMIDLTSGLVFAFMGAWLVSWVGGFAGWLAGTIAPLIFLLSKRTRRQERFQKQLPGAFELMARIIRSGQSVSQALQAAADVFGDPLSKELVTCQHQQALGLRPEVVFREMAARSGIVELRLFVMALMIQRQTGGNLSEVLERLAAMIRARLRLRQQVRSVTAEGRLQGYTLVLLPFLLFAIIRFLNRQYAESLLDHPRLLLGMLALMVVGVCWVRKIVNFEI